MLAEMTDPGEEATEEGSEEDIPELHRGHHSHLLQLFMEVMHE